jgi:uncharacterized RDD family membrane protein YckC
MEEKKNSNLTDNGKRFEAFFLDAVIAALLSMFFFAGVGAPIFSYYQTANEIATAANLVQTASAKTHLLSSVDSLSPSAEGEQALGSTWSVNQGNEAYNQESDILRYYTVSYKGGSQADYDAILLNGDYAYLFEQGSSRAQLKEEYRLLLHGYTSSGDRSADAVATHNSVYACFQEHYRAFWVEFGSSEAYLPLYKNYLSLNEKISYEAGDAALVSFVLSGLLLYCGVPFLMKKGRTFAKTALHLEVVSEKGDLQPWQILSRGVLETCELAGLSVFAPFFFIQLPSLSLRIAAFGDFSFTMIALIIASAMLCLLSGGLCLFTKEKTSLHDLATLTHVYDSVAYDKAKQEEVQSHGGDNA